MRGIALASNSNQARRVFHLATAGSIYREPTTIGKVHKRKTTERPAQECVTHPTINLSLYAHMSTQYNINQNSVSKPLRWAWECGLV